MKKLEFWFLVALSIIMVGGGVALADMENVPEVMFVAGVASVTFAILAVGVAMLGKQGEGGGW